MSKKFELIIKLVITYIFLLAICFIIYALIVLPVTGAEKVNAIIGLMGWSATIFAPIAAFYLIDNWKDQAKYNEQLTTLTSMINETLFLVKNIIDIRTNQNIGQHLVNCYHLFSTENIFIIKTKEEIKSEFRISSKENPSPNLNILEENIINLKRLYLHLDLHENKNNSNRIMILKNINIIESLIIDFKDQISYLYIENIFIDQLYNQKKNVWIEKAIYVNEYIYRIIALFEDTKESKQKIELENKIQDLLKLIKRYRTNL
ncbi:hypothetical protein R4462_04470 [Acinetobacter baumannii]|uniref:hypothetical protein n=1 Tax=Acinetobacter baumannii TaxID=470 RepID=UPI0008DCC06A|nr:hypothetical protein [Acinetobacter baumannii]MDC4459925.1 hypothetical protein [Acinetobacter baumannii]MDC4950406.1 hypothetical protein [Acinetobacter baumannii]MDO7491835.1 hypothetical protein [Acinetobacter baumannii]MDV7484918.1 hypothetical protein [Acinetobacter baumannii]MDV7530391.1 hypothetical protein [Acinetobacter baumannii]